jgi:hypothetical protein
MRMIRTKLAANMLALCLLAAGSCSGQGVSLTRDDSENSLARCQPVSPLSCALPSIRDLSHNGCEKLRVCLQGQFIEGQELAEISACDEPMDFDVADFGSIALVSAHLTLEGPPTHGVFMFTESADGWCLADLLLEPVWTHGGYCAIDARVESKPGKLEQEAELTIETERVCHMILDESELVAGESDIAMSECREIRYAIKNSTLEKVSDSDIGSFCKPE